MAEHLVVYRRDKRGQWIATAAGIKGCRGVGSTLRLARKELRTAMAEQISETIDLVEDVRLPSPARSLLVAHARARRKAQVEAARADRAAQQAVRALDALGVSLRDASDLLGLPPAKLETLLKLTD